MKKVLYTIFIILFFALCITPFIFMPLVNTDNTVGNEDKVNAPELTDDKGININYIPQMGNYFEKNFAFREKFLTLDGLVQGKIFKTSNIDTVVVGKNDTLYYSSTLDDYKGISTFSDRQAFNLVNNLNLVQNYVYSLGSKFVFTIAPNKNTLYDENMPYYEKAIINNKKNHDVFNKALENSDINYLNLFTIFENQKENLYLKHDSHWNNKGALLVYNSIFDNLSIKHESYEGTEYINEQFDGDLHNMIYPAIKDNETNQKYDIKYTYGSDKSDFSVEDANIATYNRKKSYNILMYRDSFGNSLIPFISNNVHEARYYKGIPQLIVLHTLGYKPDAIIIEKVERNVSELISTPPVIYSPKVDMFFSIDKVKSNTTVNAETLKAYNPFYSVSGEIDKKFIKNNTEIFIKVTDSTRNTNIYKAFNLSENGFTAYIEKPKNEKQFDVQSQIIVKNGNDYKIVADKKFIIK